VSEDGWVDDAPAVNWSTSVEQAEWIAERLAPSGTGLVTEVVPGGFEAYARLLHPAKGPGQRWEDTVRWAEIAAWSGMPLRSDSQFASVALPPHEPQDPAPWDAGPLRGSLDAVDAAALVGILATHTAAPGCCWFCVWDGYGWDNAVLFTVGGSPDVSLKAADPVPAGVRAGPRVRLPGRDYLLYSGAVDDALAFVDSEGQTPNLWWPADRSWCVASEIDLAWTYIGGSAELVRRLESESRIEVLPASPKDSHRPPLEGWLAGQIDDAVGRLLRAGETSIETSRGTVHATLRRPTRWGRRGRLQTTTVGRNGSSGEGWTGLNDVDEEPLQQALSFDLTFAVLGLVDT
jgi:hypothetical protein